MKLVIQSPEERAAKYIEFVSACTPQPIDNALADLIRRISEYEDPIGLAASIALTEMLYPRPWPNPDVIPLQGERPRLPPSFNWQLWADICAAVKASIPNLSIDAWRVLFEEFLSNPEMTVEQALGRAHELIRINPSKSSGMGRRGS